jgi:hypothetical protein
MKETLVAKVFGQSPKKLLYRLALYSIDIDNCNEVRFQVVTGASMKMAVFWVVAPCSLVEVHLRFTDAFCLHHQCDE